MSSKKLINNEGQLTEDGRHLVDVVLNELTPVFEEYMERGYNMFEALGVITSSIINSQKQAWLNQQSKKQ